MLKVDSNKLFFKVFRLLFLGIVVATLIFGFIEVSLQKESLLKLLQSEARSIAKSITFVSSDALIIDDNSYLIEFNSEYIKNSKNIKTIIISKTDESVFVIKKDSWKFDTKLVEVFKNMQKETESFGILQSPILKEKIFHFTYPIYFSGISWGWLHLSYDLSAYNKEVQAIYLNFIYLLFSVLVLSVVVSYYVARMFSDPIISLNEKVKNISYDNLSLELDITSDDEIGELTQTFNEMIKNLADSRKKLKASHEDLEVRVQARTYELESANNSLKQKSLELSELNKNLDSKVKEEINKRREQEEMLIYQSRLAAMGEMIGNIAHQWRQPLNALGIIIQNMNLSYMMKNLNDDFMNKSVNDSMKLTSMMSKTIDDFRNFFKPNKVKISFKLQDSLKRTMELVDSSYKLYNIKVQYEIQEDVLVYGFPNEFAQALLNILSNAKDALLENEVIEPKIIIKISKDKKYGILAVQDNAGGIKDEILNKIYEAYFTTKNDGNGTGIGLYMSKIIVEQNMNGKVECSNTKDGAIFSLSIPLND